jgi:hypothetical protein
MNDLTVEEASQVLMALYVWHDAYEESEPWWWPTEGADIIFAFMRKLESIPGVMDIVKQRQEEDA